MLVPWRKQNQLFPTRSFFDDFFERFFEQEDWSGQNAMKVDLIEKEKEFIIKANLPEFKKEEISISTQKNHIIIEANRKEKHESKKKNCIISERYYGNYHRVISLPENSDLEKIKASMKNGVLKILVPKTKAQIRNDIIIE